MGIFDWLFGKKDTPSEHKKDCCSKNKVEGTKKEKKKDNFLLGQILPKNLKSITNKVKVSDVVYHELCQGSGEMGVCYIIEKDYSFLSPRPVLKILWEDDYDSIEFEGDLYSNIFNHYYVGMGTTIYMNKDSTFRISENKCEFIYIKDNTEFRFIPRTFNLEYFIEKDKDFKEFFVNLQNIS